LTRTKIAAVGEKDIILIFKGIGADIFPVVNISEVSSLIKKLIKEGYKIIFITETIAEKVDSIIKQYLYSVFPSIVIIPGLGEKSSYAVNILKNAIVKAVGSDVF